MKYIMQIAIVIAAGMALALTPIGIHAVASSADIIHNFNLLHGMMIGGHGARLFDADVRAIGLYVAHLRDNGRQIPRIVADVSNGSNGACITGTCTVVERHDMCGGELNVIHTGAPAGTYTFSYEETSGECPTESWNQDSTLRPVFVIQAETSSPVPIYVSTDIEWAADHTLTQGTIYTGKFVHEGGSGGDLKTRLDLTDTKFTVTVW